MAQTCTVRTVRTCYTAKCWPGHTYNALYCNKTCNTGKQCILPVHVQCHHRPPILNYSCYIYLRHCADAYSHWALRVRTYVVCIQCVLYTVERLYRGYHCDLAGAVLCGEVPPINRYTCIQLCVVETAEVSSIQSVHCREFPLYACISTHDWLPAVLHVYAARARYICKEPHIDIHKQPNTSTFLPVTLNKSVPMASVLAEGSNRLATLLL